MDFGRKSVKVHCSDVSRDIHRISRQNTPATTHLSHLLDTNEAGVLSSHAHRLDPA